MEARVDEDGRGSGEAPKKAYSIPKLIEFGPVQQLAMGGAGSPAESRNMSSIHKPPS